jgi:hypothetical protein
MHAHTIEKLSARRDFEKPPGVMPGLRAGLRRMHRHNFSAERMQLMQAGVT